ncbi:tRNA (guanosine(46)-N7)-methyltransferase TrmB [Suttonella sp. R2A3]|uniref:tRNA (guanosine(46)-N7)-methyltransferase TrmB n=1 Tax=Suttonella sp. R2A3 TaxID=2908648 RepID=UPI001F3CC127|nr:tRNA (guanosine(46)-N7)-methyltransferase TrmB [Suttonella sp. R2A3]UJF24658.1 tRNA (guanosine(46)-N7)-methyltransferase TrmB [Suttonella sp. R2A3]
MTIRSFVLRQGRMTAGQERAFSDYWPSWGIDITAETNLNSRAIFGDDRELVLEIGFGNGESFLDMAEAAPEKGFIGIEVHRPGVGHALLGIAERGLTNVRLICHDAAVVVRDHMADDTLSRVQIYFPDPWPKARHHKRRIIQKPFTDLLYRKLRTGGELHCATDWENYAEWMQEVFANESKWVNLGGSDGFAPRPEWRPLTKFEQRGLNKGHGVWDLRYQANKMES